jgi:hypothetical protein
MGRGYRVEVIADDTGKWVGDLLRFYVLGDAERYARNLYSMWPTIRAWRVKDGHGHVRVIGGQNAGNGAEPQN